ncbi:MAG: substrate-binding domain-containing protein [Lentisphaeria bacterium]|nr:substrate-binding domain-containing protein [Lentisphaeria bacterium]
MSENRLAENSEFARSEWLKNILLNEIRKGTYKPGERIPSVRALCEKYDVCKQTVARAISNLDELRVLEVAHGKATRVRRSLSGDRIELIFFGSGAISSDDFWADFYRGIMDEAQNFPGYYFHVSTFASKNLHYFLDEFRKVKPAGALILSTSNLESLLELNRYSIPMLSVHDHHPASPIPAVRVDILETLAETVALLKQHNRSRIAYLYSGEAEQLEVSDGINSYKYKVFCRMLREAGMSVDFRSVSPSGDAGYRLLMQLAKEQKLPDGVVLFSDTLAPSFMRAAYELKIAVPQDMSVVGMDNLMCGKFTIPSLTTMDFCRYEQGRLALRNLVNALQNNTFPQGAVLRSSLVRRETL